MKEIIIKELYRNSENYYSKEVQVSGWVRTVRDSKTFGFIEINDGSFFKNLQIVFDNSLKNFDKICKDMKKEIISEISKMKNKTSDEIAEERYQKFRKMGKFVALN